MKEDLQNNINPELDLVLQKLNEAENPEAVFGSLETETDKLKAARSIFRTLSKATHPTLYYGKPEETTADEAFKRLNQLWEEAQQKLLDGTYGQLASTKSSTAQNISIRSKKREYEIQGSTYHQGLADLYSCTYLEGGVSQKGIFKITCDPDDNDLVGNEASVLKHLLSGKGSEKFHWYIPSLAESFVYIDESNSQGRRVNVFSQGREFFSLREVKEAYPGGIDPKDMAWIFRRLLTGLGYVHLNDVIHGATLPSNIFIYPQEHGLFIWEWAYSVLDQDRLGDSLKAINPEYERWYPIAALRKERLSPALDISMGVKCMVDVLGGDPFTGEMPNSVPKRMRQFLNGCVLPKLSRCPEDAWELIDEFDSVIEDLWGPRRFHPFAMPQKRLKSPFR